MQECSKCNSAEELTFNTLVCDYYCALCGMWQDDLEEVSK